MPAPKGRPLTRTGRITGIFLSLLLCWMSACRERPTDLVRLSAEPMGIATRLSLVPFPGVRINAVFKPALRLADGTTYRFDSPQLTPDSAYFTTPPQLMVPAGARGVVTASVCPEGLALCRVIEVEF